MSLAKNIKDYRKKTGLSQQALAVKSKISISTIYKLEQEVLKNPALDTLLVLSKVLNVSIDTLVK